MEIKKLTQDEFRATQSGPKRLQDGSPPVDFWSYVERIPVEHFEGFDCRAGDVSHVYQMDNGYQHVLINSEYKGVAMVIVVNTLDTTILGHYLLDINPPGTERAAEE